MVFKGANIFLDTEFVDVACIWSKICFWLIIATLGHLVFDEVDIQVVIFSSNPREYWLHESGQGCIRSTFQNTFWFVKMKIVDKYESVWEEVYLVTSSTWCAQALFLRIGASPCQITRMCWGEKLLDFLKLSRQLLFGLLASPPQQVHIGFDCCESWSPSCLCLPGWNKKFINMSFSSWALLKVLSKSE